MKTLFSITLLALLIIAGCMPRAAIEAPPNDSPIPAFDHIFVLVLENRSYVDVIGSSEMPRLNALAKENVLLTDYSGVAHPSLPNYIAMVSGETHGIENDCKDCFLDAENLADRLEAAERTWKTYQEGMPEPCALGNAGKYVQKHNPFVYFDSIRLDAERCAANVLPLGDLDADLASGDLPDFALIVPDQCNNGHDCAPAAADAWIGSMVERLQASPEVQQTQSLIVITYDESQTPGGLTGLVRRITERNRERIVTVLISPVAKAGLEDSTPYNHYSLLKTILLAWGLPPLGHTADETVTAIRAPWIAP
jgi:phospholipase C